MDIAGPDPVCQLKQWKLMKESFWTMLLRQNPSKVQIVLLCADLGQVIEADIDSCPSLSINVAKFQLIKSIS